MENLATSNYIQRGLASKRKQELAKALLQKIEASNPGPNDMVSGRVVPNNPIAQALNTFTGGMADSRLRSAEQEQGQLEDEKRNQLVQALSGGKPLTSEALAQSGASPDDLIKFATQQQSNISGPVYDFIPTPNGILRVDKRSKETELLPYQAAAQSPQLQGQITAARSGNKLYPLDTMEGRQYQTGYQLNQDLQNQQPQNIQNNQQSGLPSDDVRNVDALNMVEASGSRDPSLKNPNSTASGGLQIIDGTREQLGLPKNAPYEQDEAKIDEYQQSLEKKYGNKGLAGLAHYKGEGYVDQILARKRKLTNDDYIYMGKMEEARYGLANKAKPITPQQKNDLKTQQEIDASAGKAKIESDAKQRAADMALINSEPTQQAGNETSLRNRQEYAKELDKYVKSTGGNPLLDNNPVYRLREAIGAEDNISNLQSMAANFVQEQMTLMQQSGLSPARMMDSNAEREAFERSVAGNCNAAAKKSAFDRYNSKVDALIQAHKEEVRRAKARQGIEPQQAPLQQQQYNQQELQPGTVEDGHIYIGGDPSRPENWKPQ